MRGPSLPGAAQRDRARVRLFCAPMPSLSVIVPAYNEARRIAPTLRSIGEHLERRTSESEILVVDDGSTDDTIRIVESFVGGAPQGGDAPPRRALVRLVSGHGHHGKGHAVRRGMLAAFGDLRLMCDADLSVPIEEVDKLLPWIERGFGVVIGSRDMPDARLDPPQPLGRRLLAWTFRAARRRLLLPEVHDTQVGFKLFTSRAAVEVFSRATIDGWAFDVEALAIADARGLRIREVGVTWRDDRDSRVRPLRDGPAALRDLLAIRRRLKARTAR